MISILKSNERGKTQIDWLESFHSFSFGDYYNPNAMGFSDLRVINEDIIKSGSGFGKHPHRNMEIITYVIAGALEHKDSLGTGSVIKPGEIQRMSAGTGIEHSEFNHYDDENLHLLQIWILPEQGGIKPSYEQKPIKKTVNQFIAIAGKKGGVTIHQDVVLFVAYLTKNHVITFPMNHQRKGWLQLIKGKIELNNEALFAGDGACLIQETSLNIKCLNDAELLFFDLK